MLMSCGNRTLRSIIYHLICIIQARINHMAKAAYATGPALLGAPRLLFSGFFKTVFVLQRGAQNVWGPKARGPMTANSVGSQKAWSQKAGPKFNKIAKTSRGP